VSNAEKIIQEFALAKANNVDDLLLRYCKVRQQIPAVRTFYGAKWMQRKRRWLLWHNKHIRRKMAVDEQRQCDKQIIRAIGHAGSGVGTRIKGHLKYGGKWHRKICRQQGIVLVTNEHRTSMTCPFCHSRIIHPKNKGKSNNGTSCCINTKCETVKIGKNSFGRDALSATCIAIRAYGQITGQSTI
jgi:hypothetical protein